MTRTAYLAAFDTWFGVRMNNPEPAPNADEYAESWLFSQAERRYLARRYEQVCMPTRFAAAVKRASLPESGDVGDFCALLRPLIDRFDEITIAKSSLLCRLLYMGETLRATPCPTHAGRWSGIDPCEHGCGGTGWIK